MKKKAEVETDPLNDWIVQTFPFSGIPGHQLVNRDVYGEWVEKVVESVRKMVSK